MLNKGYYKIEFKAEGHPAAQTVNTETIKSLILADGTVVIRNGYLLKRDSDKNKVDAFGYIRASKLSTIGGTLIGISGLLLFSNNQRTVDDNATLEEIEEFRDESKSNTDLSYILLVLGGLLIAIDNS